MVAVGAAPPQPPCWPAGVVVAGATGLVVLLEDSQSLQTYPELVLVVFAGETGLVVELEETQSLQT